MTDKVPEDVMLNYAPPKLSVFGSMLALTASGSGKKQEPARGKGKNKYP